MKKIFFALLVIGIQPISFPVFANTIFQCPSMAENLITTGNDDNGWKMQISYWQTTSLERREGKWVVRDYIPPLDIKNYHNKIKSMS